MGHTWAHMGEHGPHVDWKFFELSPYEKKMCFANGLATYCIYMFLVLMKKLHEL